MDRPQAAQVQSTGVGATGRRLRLALVRFALGSLVIGAALAAGCSTGGGQPSDREYTSYPPLADKHVDVHATARELDSQVQHISRMRDGTLILLRQIDPATGAVRHEHEAWASFPGIANVHVFTIGDPAVSPLPKQTRFEWGGQTLTLDHTDGVITGGVYIDKDGRETRYVGGGMGSTAEALTVEETEEYLEQKLTWFIEVRHHPVVDWFRSKVEKAKEMLDKFGARLDAVTESLRNRRSHRIFFTSPVRSLPPGGAAERDIVEVAREAEARILAEKPASNHLPDAVEKRHFYFRGTMQATSWEPERMLCSRSYSSKSQGIFRTEYACAVDAEDCEAAGGTAWSGLTGSCTGACKSFFGKDDPVTLGSYDPSTDELTCSMNACVDSFTEDTPDLQPATGAQCCAAGLKHDACGTAPVSDAGPRDGGSGDVAPPDGGPPPALKCGRFEILEAGTPPPTDDGSGRVRDTVTKLVWTRNYFRAYTVPYSGTYKEAADACSKVGMRVPTRSELLKMLDAGYCDQAFNYGKTSFAWTSTKYNTDTWWCVLMSGTSEYCVNRPGAACVK